MILEFYARGNVILCDHEYKIMALLRTADVASATGEPDDDVRYAVGEIYPLDTGESKLSVSDGWVAS